MNQANEEDKADGVTIRDSIGDEPWFVGKDVVEALGYSNPRKTISDHVDDEDKGVPKMSYPWRIARINGYQRVWSVLFNPW